jgi:hypothetical protein
MRLRGANVLNTTIRGHQHEDGYVSVGSNGETVVNSLVQDTLFASIVNTATGLWTATLKEPPPCNLNYFNVVPQIHSGDTPAVVFFQLLTDNVGTTGTTLATGSNPAVIHWKFCNSSGTAADLPANAGFKYEIGIQISTSYYTKSY